MVSEKKIFFLSFTHYKSMRAYGSRGVASLDPRGLTGRIYVVDHYTLLHTKPISSGPHGFREDFFNFFPIISLWELITPLGVVNLDPRGMVGRIYVGDHLTSLHT